MLIVLLDCSSSMNEPLEGDMRPAGAGVRKIDLARHVLNEHLAGAHSQERVIVLGFAGRAAEIARGHSTHDLILQSRIDAARLGSGTDIPAALAAAASAVRSEPADGLCTVIVITDGLLDGRPDEDLDSAVAELSPLVACVKVSLIGASERGLKVAMRISRNAPIALRHAMRSIDPDDWREERDERWAAAATRSLPEPDDWREERGGPPTREVGIDAELLELPEPDDWREERGGPPTREVGIDAELLELPEPDDWLEERGGPPTLPGSPHSRSVLDQGMPTVKMARMAPRVAVERKSLPAGMAPPAAEEREGSAMRELRELAVGVGETRKDLEEGSARALNDLERHLALRRGTPEEREGPAVMAAIEPRASEEPEGAATVVERVASAVAVPEERDRGTPQSMVLAHRLETLERATFERERERVRCREPSLGHARDVEDVAVTVAHAPGVARGVWHPLDVFVHLASLEDEVARIVRAERGHGAARASRGARLRRGTTVRIEPHIEGAELDVDALEMRWRDDVQRAAFRIRPVAGATELRGSVDVYVKHAILCTVPIAIAVIDTPRPAEPPVTATGRMMNMVFVSYATEERPIVERVTRTYRELGITVLMDKDFLHAGDTTGEVLRSQIERADVFQLFWSKMSSQKPWVEREWRHALTLTGPAGRKGARFIRPLVWERQPPAWPPELAALQFSRLEPAWLARAGAHPGIFAAMCLAAAMGFAAVVAIVFALAAVR